VSQILSSDSDRSLWDTEASTQSPFQIDERLAEIPTAAAAPPLPSTEPTRPVPVTRCGFPQDPTYPISTLDRTPCRREAAARRVGGEILLLSHRTVRLFFCSSCTARGALALFFLAVSLRLVSIRLVFAGLACLTLQSPKIPVNGASGLLLSRPIGRGGIAGRR